MKVYVMVHFDHTIDSDLSVAASIAKHCEEIERGIRSSRERDVWIRWG